MLYDKLKNYSKNGVYPFHMPGHKRIIINNEYTIPYEIDITEVHGFDNLHDADGCIKEIEDKSAHMYSVKRAFLLVNGATGGILSAIRAMTKYGDKIIVARNCHKSVYNAIELCGLNPVYVMPESIEKYGIYSHILPQKIEMLLSENPDAKLVIMTSPTYEGVVSDIKAISEICKKYNVKLFVDEAHGAHFPFSVRFPSESVRCGADVAVVSLHKTLPSLTQTALLLTNNPALENQLKDNLSVFETSSPSYVLMSSIENCLDYISDNKSVFYEYIHNLDDFYSESQNLKNLKILYSDEHIKQNVFDYDIGKIIISTADTTLSGIELAKILREKFKIETEMAYTNYVIAMTSLCDSKEGFNRLTKALFEIDKFCKSEHKSSDIFNIISEIPDKAFKSSNRFDYTSEKLPIKSAKGRASLEYIWAYPPGIPLVVPGEIITEEVILTIDYLKSKKVEIYSSEKNLPDYISVAEF